MANKGSSKHMKGLAAPKFYSIHRKEHKYVVRPNPGRHSVDRSMPLLLALKKLSAARTKSEAGKIARSGEVLVNGRPKSEMKFPVGLNDIIELKKAGKAYMVGVDKLGKVALRELKKPDYDAQLYRVMGKYKVGGGAIMVRLNDGRAIKGEGKVKVNDSVAIDRSGKIRKVMPMAVGAGCLVIDGVHVGETGRIKEIKQGTMNVTATATIEQESGEKFDTIIKNIMVTG